MDNPGAYILIISTVIAFIVIYAYLKREVLDATEKSAAKTTRGILFRFGATRGYKVLSNIPLNNDGGEIIIENMLIGYFGILLVRTLGLRGEYYGTLDSENWTLAVGNKKHVLPNPVKRLEREEAALRSLFSKNKIYNVPVEKVVYISSKSSKTAVYVTHSGEIALGGKLTGYIGKSKFEKDTGLDVKQIAGAITGIHTK